MDYYLIFGMVVASLISVLSFIWAIKSNSQKEQEIFTELKICITELKDEIRAMRDNDTTRDKRLDKHDERLDSIEGRVSTVETKMNFYHSNRS